MKVFIILPGHGMAQQQERSLHDGLTTALMPSSAAIQVLGVHLDMLLLLSDHLSFVQSPLLACGP